VKTNFKIDNNSHGVSTTKEHQVKCKERELDSSIKHEVIGSIKIKDKYFVYDLEFKSKIYSDNENGV